MKKTITSTLGLLLILVFLPLSGQAQLHLSTDYVSSYIWRGFDLNPVNKPVFQSTIGYQFGESGVYAEFWGSFSFQDRDLHEMDLMLSYTYDGLKDVELTAGFFHYGWYFVDHFDFSRETSQEVFITGQLSRTTFQPSLTVYYDFTNGDGVYLELKSEESFQLSPQVVAHAFVSLGYNGGQWLPERADPGFSDLNWGFDFPVQRGSFELVPFIRWTRVLLDAIGRETHFWYGLSLGWAPDGQGSDL